jgi:hypothetical protein
MIFAVIIGVVVGNVQCNVKLLCPSLTASNVLEQKMIEEKRDA